MHRAGPVRGADGRAQALSADAGTEGLWLVGTDAGGRGVGTENAATSALYVAALTGELDLLLPSRPRKDTSEMMFIPSNQ